jgi:hypothetical protein
MPTATATPVPVYESGETTSAISAEVSASIFEFLLIVLLSDIDNLEDGLATALGKAVFINDENLEVTNTEEGLVTKVLVFGASEPQAISGELDITLGDLSVETVDGLGTATLALDTGLNVEGSATVDVIDGAIEVTMSDLHLVFEPEAPDASTLDGGSADVTNFGVNFDVGLSSVPDDASLTVQFIKSSSAFSNTNNDAIRKATEKLGVSIQDSENDIAFAVNVDETGIDDDELGTNIVTMTVSSAWYDSKLAEGKSIAITKINDLGVGFSSLASCSVTGDSVDCGVEFSGEASGFSLFVLMGVSGETTPTATATQLPTATAPTATLTPKSFVSDTSTRTLAPAPTATTTQLPTATYAPTAPPPVSATPTATATPAPTTTKTSVPPTSTSTSVPPTATRTATSVPTATATAVVVAPGAAKPTGGFPVAAFIGVAIVVIALFAGASAYLWKSGQYQTLLSSWRRFKETGLSSWRRMKETGFSSWIRIKETALSYWRRIRETSH